MSDWANDIYMMHNKFGVKEWFAANKGNKELMAKYLTFRLNMCLEELLETAEASDLELAINEDGKFAFAGDGVLCCENKPILVETSNSMSTKKYK